MVSDFNKLSKKGFGWVQAGMVCFDLGCDEASPDTSGIGAAAAGQVMSNAATGTNTGAAPIMQSPSNRAGTSARAASGARAIVGPTPGPAAVDRGSMFVEKKPVVHRTGTVASKSAVGLARASGHRKLSSAYNSGYSDDMTYTINQPYSFVSTPNIQSVPIEAQMVTSNPAPQLCRFAICRPRVLQQSWSGSGR
jgi:hypothetical protein